MAKNRLSQATIAAVGKSVADGLVSKELSTSEPMARDQFKAWVRLKTGVVLNDAQADTIATAWGIKFEAVEGRRSKKASDVSKAAAHAHAAISALTDTMFAGADVPQSITTALEGLRELAGDQLILF